MSKFVCCQVCCQVIFSCLCYNKVKQFCRVSVIMFSSIFVFSRFSCCQVVLSFLLIVYIVLSCLNCHVVVEFCRVSVIMQLGCYSCFLVCLLLCSRVVLPYPCFLHVKWFRRVKYPLSCVQEFWSCFCYVLLIYYIIRQVLCNIIILFCFINVHVFQ